MDRRWRNHGRAPQGIRHRGRAVPPRVHPVRARPRAAEKLPGSLIRRRCARAHATSPSRVPIQEGLIMPITHQEALLRCIEHREIFHDEMLHLFRQIMSGEMSPTMIAALTMGLRVKKETIGEIAAAAQVMREFSTKVPMANTTGLLDIVGTGGDGANTFNISTASMFVAAAAGATVAKHGNRSVSSKSGSADVLEALGAKISLTPQQVGECIETIGCGFMFAPNHH